MPSRAGAPDFNRALVDKLRDIGGCMENPEDENDEWLAQHFGSGDSMQPTRSTSDRPSRGGVRSAMADEGDFYRQKAAVRGCKAKHAKPKAGKTGKVHSPRSDDGSSGPEMVPTRSSASPPPHGDTGSRARQTSTGSGRPGLDRQTSMGSGRPHWDRQSSGGFALDRQTSIGSHGSAESMGSGGETEGGIFLRAPAHRKSLGLVADVLARMEEHRKPSAAGSRQTSQNADGRSMVPTKSLPSDERRRRSMALQRGESPISSLATKASGVRSQGLQGMRSPGATHPPKCGDTRSEIVTPPPPLVPPTGTHEGNQKPPPARRAARATTISCGRTRPLLARGASIIKPSAVADAGGKSAEAQAQPPPLPRASTSLRSTGLAAAVVARLASAVQGEAAGTGTVGEDASPMQPSQPLREDRKHQQDQQQQQQVQQDELELQPRPPASRRPRSCRTEPPKVSHAVSTLREAVAKARGPQVDAAEAFAHASPEIKEGSRSARGTTDPRSLRRS